ncbi:MAG: DUF2797 domain-containing protein [Candidatus Nanohaloarchaea archaeon]
MRAVVKVKWRKDEDWRAVLRTATADGYREEELPVGKKLDFEIGSKRRCTGHWVEQGEMKPCPGFREIDSGDQCSECRRKDYYRDYVTGRSGIETDDDFSVYLAQCGKAVKVGVARSSRLEKRWVEQGADHAAEISGGLSSQEALDRESEMSDRGFSERIAKEKKLGAADSVLGEKLDELGLEAETVDVQSLTAYPEISPRNVERAGRFSGELRSVKGQILSNGRMAIALTSGKVLQEPSQAGLGDF